MSHFAGLDSSVEFDAGTFPLGLVTFSYDCVIYQFRHQALAGVQN